MFSPKISWAKNMRLVRLNVEIFSLSVQHDRFFIYPSITHAISINENASNRPAGLPYLAIFHILEICMYWYKENSDFSLSLFFASRTVWHFPIFFVARISKGLTGNRISGDMIFVDNNPRSSFIVYTRGRQPAAL